MVFGRSKPTPNILLEGTWSPNGKLEGNQIDLEDGRVVIRPFHHETMVITAIDGVVRLRDHSHAGSRTSNQYLSCSFIAACILMFKGREACRPAPLLPGASHMSRQEEEAYFKCFGKKKDVRGGTFVELV